MKMPLKVTLISPRSRLPGVKVSSTISVNSEFEYLNLPAMKSPRKSGDSPAKSIHTTTADR